MVDFGHVWKKEVDHPIIVVQQGIVKGQLPLLALILDLFDVALVQSLEILQDESHFLKILLEQWALILCENRLSVENEIVTFNIKLIRLLGIFVEVILDYKSHVAEGKIDVVSKDQPVVSICLYPVAVLKSKFAVGNIKVWHLSIVAFKLAARRSRNDIIVLNDVLTSRAILEG